MSIKFVDPIPLELRDLYDGQNRQATEFHCNIRLYNKALAFTSTGGSGSLVGTSYDGGGPPLYKIQGEIFHQISPILPDNNCLPRYSQMYIYDHNEALQYRMCINPDRDVATMQILQHVLENHHPSVRIYQQTYQLTQSTPLTDYHVQLNFRESSNRCRYNLPSTNNELALIIPGDKDVCANSQHIILRPTGGPLMCITECHPAYLSLHFPLLFPTRQPSWHPHIPYVQTDSCASQQSHFITLCDFFKYHLHPHPTHVESCHLFQSEHLFQELLVHAWAAAENSRLSWVCHHQADLRAELYKGAVDALHEGVDAASIGKKVVLPTTFTSGPRCWISNLSHS